MTKKKCPLGEACDLTIAWMAGAAKAQDQIKAQAAEIERLRGEVARLRNAAAVVVVIHREAKEFGAFRSTNFTTALSLAVSDLKEALTGSATVKDSLTTEDEKQSHEWKCPIDYPGCRKNCGSQYGCKS